MRTRVKICGITNLPDAVAAIEAGADALGFVFYEKSPRFIAPSRARDIITMLPPFVSMVGLFVNAEESFVVEAVELSGINVLQFHGDESDEFCAQFGLPYFKALGVPDSQAETALLNKISQYPSAVAILLDSYDPVKHGGTGKAFDWNKATVQMNKPMILAGGLTPENVSLAINKVAPFAVDVSGGVEREKGQKDHALIKQFIQEVNRANEI